MQYPLSIVLFCVMLFSFSSANAEKFKFKKVSKDIKKEARKYEKDGWKVEPGNMPIKNQLENSFSKQNEVTEEGFPKWITANGSSVAQTQSAAEMQAIELGKNRLVGLIETHMKDVITSDVANNQIDNKDAATITKTIETSTNTVSKKLGRVLPLFKVYRTVGNNTEVQVLLAYNYSMVLKDIIDQMKTELQHTAADQRKKFDKFLNADAYKTGEIVNATDSN
jgi:hypothetical protein